MGPPAMTCQRCHQHVREHPSGFCDVCRPKIYCECGAKKKWKWICDDCDLDKQDSTNNSPIKDVTSGDSGEKECSRTETQDPRWKCPDCGGRMYMYTDGHATWKECFDCKSRRDPGTSKEDVSLIGMAKESDAEEKDFK